MLRGVSFAVHESDRIALVGLNGSGKSTLMRLLVGSALPAADTADGSDRREAEPDEGLITGAAAWTWVRAAGAAPASRCQRARGAARGLRKHAAAVAELDRLNADLTTLSGRARDTALSRQAELHEHRARNGGWEVEHEIRGMAAALELPRLPPASATCRSASGVAWRWRRRFWRDLSCCCSMSRPTTLMRAPSVARDPAAPSPAPWCWSRTIATSSIASPRASSELDRDRLHAYEGNYRRFLEKQAERLDNEAQRERERAMFVRRGSTGFAAVHRPAPPNRKRASIASTMPSTTSPSTMKNPPSTAA